MPPPPVITRPSGSRVAAEWYCRTRLALAKHGPGLGGRVPPLGGEDRIVQVDQPVDRLLCPPVARTLPSASTVRLNMPASDRHRGSWGAHWFPSR